jgi:hypothetical protein
LIRFCLPLRVATKNNRSSNGMSAQKPQRPSAGFAASIHPRGVGCGIVRV